MTAWVRLVFNPFFRTSAGAFRVWLVCENDSGQVAPTTLPKLSISRINDGGDWVDEVTSANMKNNVNDGETINGAVYYYDFAPSDAGERGLMGRATVGGVVRSDSGCAAVDAPVPAHTHDGKDAPRVKWGDIAERPGDLQGEVEEPAIIVHEVVDYAVEGEHGRRTLLVREHGFGGLEGQRADTALKAHTAPEREFRDVLYFEREPKRGDTLRLLDVGVDLEIQSAEDLGGGYYDVVAGRVEDPVQRRDAEAEARLASVERYHE